MSEFFGLGQTPEQKAEKEAAAKQARADKAAAKAERDAAARQAKEAKAREKRDRREAARKKQD